MTKEYIKLENAHITQHTDGAEKSEWSLEANNTDEKLHQFPNTFTEKQMFNILDFARKYELEAWNSGIKFGRNKAKEIWEKKIELANKQIKYMREENARLAQALEGVYEKLEEQ